LENDLTKGLLPEKIVFQKMEFSNGKTLELEKIVFQFEFCL